MDNSIQAPVVAPNIELDINTKSTLLDLARWATILAVIGIIFTVGVVGSGLMFVLFLIAEHSSLESQLGQAAMLLFVGASILCIAFNIYPIYILLRYAKGIKNAINQNDQKVFNKSIARLRNFFRYMVIGIIVSIVLYVFALLALAIAIGMYNKI